MPERPLRFDPFLPHINSNELKSMVRMWGGGSQTRKDDCIALIRQGLADPAKVRAAVATLAPWEANALALVKAAGGALDGGALCVALRASGVNLPGGRLARADDRVALLLPLIKRGLVLTDVQRQSDLHERLRFTQCLHRRTAAGRGRSPGGDAICTQADRLAGRNALPAAASDRPRPDRPAASRGEPGRHRSDAKRPAARQRSAPDRQGHGLERRYDTGRWTGLSQT